jgi:hypothetical protein
VAADQAFGLEFGVRIRYRRAMNAKLPGQFAARRNTVAGAQLPGVHPRAELIAQLHVQRNVALGLQMEWQHWMHPTRPI